MQVIPAECFSFVHQYYYGTKQVSQGYPMSTLSPFLTFYFDGFFVTL